MTIIKRILAIFTASCFFCLCVAAEDLTFLHSVEEIYEDKTGDIKGTDNAKIVVEESKTIRNADKEILGLGMGNGADQGAWLKPGTTELSDDAVRILNEMYDVPSVRFQFHGEIFSNIGPLASRKGSRFVTVSDGKEHERLTNMTPYGPVELIKMFQTVNPDVEFVICVDIDDTPENIANFAHFLFDGAEDSKWGAMRVGYGVKEPLPVNKVIFEMGNERDAATDNGIGWAYKKEQLDWYVGRAGAAVDAIHAEFPDALICLCGKTAPWGKPDTHREWTRGLAAAMKGKFQYWSQHLYYSGNEICIIEDYMNWVTEDLNEVLGEGHGVQILMTEHAKWPDLGPNLAEELLTLEAVLATGMFLSRMYRRTDIHAAHYHSCYGMNYRCWPMFVNLDGKFLAMGMEQMYNIFLNALGDRIVTAEYTGDSERLDITKPTCRYAVTATVKGKREMNIIMVNRSPDHDINLDFDFENNYTLVEETVFTAPNICSMIVSHATKDVFTTTVTEKNEKGFKSYKMPNKSFVILKLVSDSDIREAAGDAGEEEIIEEVESGFTDISSSWAKNEISLMAKLGYITGKSESTFEPEKMITRAEVSAIAARMIESEISGRAASYGDVSADAWYAPYVNKLYYCGIMQGDGSNFYPDRNVTVEELSAIANRIYERAGKITPPFDEEAVLGKYKSPDAISPWALTDIAKATARGFLYRLYENGRLITHENAARETAASIFYRLQLALNR